MQQGSPDSYNVDLDLMALYKNISVNVNLQRKVKGRADVYGKRHTV